MLAVLVLLPAFLPSDLFKGTRTETGNVPHFPSHPPPSLLVHPSCSVFSGLLLCLTGSPTVPLLPCQPQALLSKESFPELQGWNLMFTLSCQPHSVQRFEEPENLLLYLGLFLALLFEEGPGGKN